MSSTFKVIGAAKYWGDNQKPALAAGLFCIAPFDESNSMLLKNQIGQKCYNYSIKALIYARRPNS